MQHRKAIHFLRRFTRDEHGLAFIEFAFLLPILMTLFYGIVEVSRLVQMNQKIGNASHQMVDLINQNMNLSLNLLDAYTDTLPAMVAPYDANGVGVVISCIKVEEGTTDPITQWQYVGGTKPRPSRISGGKNQPPDPSKIPPLVESDQIITVEIFLDYRPILDNDVVGSILGLDEEGVYRVSIARPRFGAFEFEPV